LQLIGQIDRHSLAFREGFHIPPADHVGHQDPKGGESPRIETRQTFEEIFDIVAGQTVIGPKEVRQINIAGNLHRH